MYPAGILISYETETQIFVVLEILKIFVRINFRKSPIIIKLKSFAGIDFRESTFSGSNREFNLAKLSSHKVHPQSQSN